MKSKSVKEIVVKALARGKSLANADLQGADLQRAPLWGADLQGADLRSANLQRAYLWGDDLQNADLRYADLQYANLQGADLQYADLRYANLRYADLRSANLQNADLRRADLHGACGENFVLFCAGKHNAIFAGGNGCIGCERHTYQEWLDNYQTIGIVSGYSDAEIARYYLLIKAAIECLRLVESQQAITRKERNDEILHGM